MNTQLYKSKHAECRGQQRGIPPLITQWLIDYGEEVFDGHGGIVRFFTSQAIRNLERDIGKEPIRRLHEYMRCYLIQASTDGVVITVGKRHKSKKINRH